MLISERFNENINLELELNCLINLIIGYVVISFCVSFIFIGCFLIKLLDEKSESKNEFIIESENVNCLVFNRVLLFRLFFKIFIIVCMLDVLFFGRVKEIFFGKCILFIFIFLICSKYD